MKPIPVERAFQLLEDAIAPLPPVRLSLSAALNRVSAEKLSAQCDLPLFDQSAMDGYALRAADVVEPPTRLPLAQTVAAGPHSVIPELPKGHACRIYTGGLIPLGADAVVRQEWAQSDGASVVIERETPAGQDLRRQGEELRRGAHLMDSGQRLNPGHLAMLAMAGVAQLAVTRAPKITVLISGDEIVDAGRALSPGEVYNANGPLIAAWMAQAGYPILKMAHIADDEAAVSQALAEAFESSDLVLTTGGVSVGDRDLIAPEAEKLGAEKIFWKVAQKPGKPLYVAKKGLCLLMGLPGNPASVLVNLAVFVRRALDVMEGLQAIGPAQRSGVLSESVARDGSRECWVRVRTQISEEGVMQLLPQSHQASHMLSNLAQANALVRVAAGEKPLAAGSLVQWVSLGV